MPGLKKFDVEWLDIDNIDAPDDDLRLRGFAKGAARFARGEGICLVIMSSILLVQMEEDSSMAKYSATYLRLRKGFLKKKTNRQH